MIDQARLTEDLRKLLDKELLPALRKRAEREKALDAALREEHAAAKAARRTGQAFEMWREDTLTQVGVAWVLGCVFVRFMEDNGLVDAKDHFPRIAGAGASRKYAEDQRTDYFRRHGTQTDRDYLLWAFTDLAALPACKELFSKAHNPLWSQGGLLMDADAATRLIEFFQQVDGKAEGKLLYDFNDASLSTRFLGDLYQNLSEAARKKYALLQTPVFVEEFILDRTLEPAIKEFGLCDQRGRELSAQRKPIPSDHLLRMIDPTVGSGHFLLGGFERLFAHWQKQEPMTEPAVLAERCLNSLFGVDLNPYAANIARFRLLVAALRACGIKRLREARDWTINIAVGDSLLHGSFAGGAAGGELFEAQVRTDSGSAHVTSAEDLEVLRRFLMPHRYHVVVGIVAIHEVLEKVVAPVAEHSPVLLVVLDGMSVPVFLELRSDLLSHGWSSVRPSNSGTTPLILSSIPSVTQYARVSLLSGSRRSGGQAEEAAGFSTNPPLCAVSRNSTPALFHKAVLTSGDESTVSVIVRDAIQSPTRVVGLVINAIDDLLSKGDQISIRWTASAIRMLPSLLGLARDAGRAVILVSDHGHVAELGTTQVRGGDSDRYRSLDTPPADGEITLEGPGVHPDISGQRLIAPWSEAMRYSVRKAGYHGGVSLQEMVVPNGVFFYGQRLPVGLSEVSAASPSWWSLDDSEAGVAKAPVVTTTTRTSGKGTAETLFEQPIDVATAAGSDLTWLDSALASDVFASQRRLAGRTPPSAEEVRRLIVCLADRGGKLTKTAMSRALGLPDLRLPGYLSLMRRILNVDGYAVLSVHEESSTIEFNVTLFKTQFGVR